jgi:hypothetical protein
MKVSLVEMTRQEKLDLLEDLWADIAKDSDLYESPAWHADELSETAQRVAAGKENFVDWETAKQQIISKNK